MSRASVGQRCPECRRIFQVLADEAQMHPCPHCGYHPRYDYPTPGGCTTLWEDDPAPVEDDIERSRRLRRPA
jgi:hypothetical protein